MNVQKYYLKILFTKKNILIPIITLSMITLSVFLLYGNLSFNDILIWEFIGQGNGDFVLMRFLTMLIYNSVPVYLLCLFIEKDCTERSMHLTIRLKSKKRWMKAILYSSFLFVISYILISICITAITAFVSGMDFMGFNGFNYIFATYSIKPVAPCFLYLAVVVGKSLELLFCFFIILLIYCYTRKVTIGFLILLMSYFLIFIPTNVVTYLPTGVSSLSRILEFSGTGLPFWQVVAILIIINGILYGYIRFISYKKIFD